MEISIVRVVTSEVIFYELYIVSKVSVVTAESKSGIRNQCS